VTATVAHIFRHPIKSHGREEIGAVELIAGQTMPMDRRWAVAHEASNADGSEWVVCANFSRGSKAPGLMAIEARVNADEGSVTLTHPTIGQITFDPERDAQEFLKWVAPIMPPDRAKSARIIQVPGRGLTDSPFPSVSLASLSSNAALSDRVGMDLSPRRWRANFWIDGLDAWQEFDWVGQVLEIGEAQITVREPIVRCLATAANPDTGVRDADTLGALESGWGHRTFGVYCEVIKGGTVSLGDRVRPL